MSEQKDKFNELLENHCSSLGKKKDKCVISQEVYDKAVQALLLETGTKCDNGAKFKYWCKNQFKVETIGCRNILYCSKTSLPVTTKEDMFDTILRCHLRVGHTGRDKTFDEVKRNYAWVNRNMVLFFLQTCPVCNTRKPLKQPKTGKPIISLGFLTRVQVDLIDMSSRPDADYKWILHARDHFTKYSWAYPLMSKKAEEVAEKLIDIFCQFGPAKILQSDNGREFVAKVINETANLWPGLVIIHGRPRHPQSQGCVERGNGDLQVKLGKWVDENGDQWSKGLKFVVHAINTSTAKATGRTPYELVFGQRPQQDFFTLQNLAEQNLLHEEDIDPAILQKVISTDPTHEETCASPVDNIENTHSNEEADSQAATLLLQLSSGSTIDFPLTDDVDLSSSNTNHLTFENVTDEIQGNLKLPTVSQKRSRMYQLYADGNIVAQGYITNSYSTLHGRPINKDTQMIIEIQNVFDSSYIPAENNPFQEPLQEGQFVCWEKNDVLVEEEDTPHAKVRNVARENYLATAPRQTEKYQNQVAHLQKTYNAGDTVGIKIYKIDRSNTAASVLPCKVLSVKSNVRCAYKLYTASGILSVNYSSDDLLDLRHVVFPELDNLDPTDLKEVSVIRASRGYSGWCSSTTDISLCSCTGSCITKRCRCRKAGIECSTKCHSSNSSCCQNKM